MKGIPELQAEMHSTAVQKGWWEGTTKENCPIPEKIALMHSELSEALEEYRNGKEEMYFDGDKPEGITVELGDVMIRILDLAGFMNWDIEAAIEAKMKYNKTRPYRHGGKRI